MQVAVEVRQLIRRQIGVVRGLILLVHEVLQASQQALELVGARLVRLKQISPVLVSLALLNILLVLVRIHVLARLLLILLLLLLLFLLLLVSVLVLRFRMGRVLLWRRRRRCCARHIQPQRCLYRCLYDGLDEDIE